MPQELLQEHQSVRITRATKTAFVGSRSEDITLPAGSAGVIIGILGDPDNPAYYHIEVYLKETDEFAVANVPVEFVEPR